MVMATSVEQRVKDLHDRAVQDLIAAHRQRTEEPLALAIRYGLDDPEDIHILEVLDGFPGPDDDELLITEFEPSAQLRILGACTWPSPALPSSSRPFRVAIRRSRN